MLVGCPTVQAESINHCDARLPKPANLLLRPAVIRIQRWQQKIHLGKSSMLWSLRLYFEYTIVSSERSSCSYAPLLVQLTTKPACWQLFGIFSQTTSQLAQVPQKTNKQTNCTLHCMLHCNAVTACNTAHLKQQKKCNNTVGAHPCPLDELKSFLKG